MTLNRKNWATLDEDSSNPSDREYAQSALIGGVCGLIITLWAAMLAFGGAGALIVGMTVGSSAVIAYGLYGLKEHPRASDD